LDIGLATLGGLNFLETALALIVIFQTAFAGVQGAKKQKH
jgi:hypothetical protein